MVNLGLWKTLFVPEASRRRAARSNLSRRRDVRRVCWRATDKARLIYE